MPATEKLIRATVHALRNAVAPMALEVEMHRRYQKPLDIDVLEQQIAKLAEVATALAKSLDP